MTKKKEIEEERNIKVKAKVNLKYDEDVIKIGEDFDIRESDLEDMLKSEYIDYTPAVQQSQQGDNTEITPPDNN